MGDDNKIVYMSNINSCSLPLSPKEEQVPKKNPPSNINIDSTMGMGGSNHEIIMNKVFEY